MNTGEEFGSWSSAKRTPEKKKKKEQQQAFPTDSASHVPFQVLLKIFSFPILFWIGWLRIL